MGDEKDRVGIGRVIYSVDEEGDDTQSVKQAERAAGEDVEEADRESFPASDPPGFIGGAATDQG